MILSLLINPLSLYGERTSSSPVRNGRAVWYGLAQGCARNAQREPQGCGRCRIASGGIETEAEMRGMPDSIRRNGRNRPARMREGAQKDGTEGMRETERRGRGLKKNAWLSCQALFLGEERCRSCRASRRKGWRWGRWRRSERRVPSGREWSNRYAPSC